MMLWEFRDIIQNGGYFFARVVKYFILLYNWSFSQYNTRVRWLIHRNMIPYKQTASRQTFMSGQHLQKRAAFLTSGSIG